MRIYIEQNGFGRVMGATLNGAKVSQEQSSRRRFVISKVLDMIHDGYPSEVWNSSRGYGTDTCCDTWVTPD